MDSGKTKALSEARRLKKIMLKHGVPEVSIELKEGRPSPYGRWYARYDVADMSHHVVSRLGSNLTPLLSLVRTGRKGLDGPLANGYGGWDLTYRIITFGYANHPGEGGPITVPTKSGGRYTIPKNSARRYTWGTEYEGGLNRSDWDKVLKNPRNGKKMTMREFMGRCNAALEEFLEIHPNAHLEHSTWTKRKIDRLGYTQTSGIAEKKKYANQNVEEPEMELKDSITLTQSVSKVLGMTKQSVGGAMQYASASYVIALQNRSLAKKNEATLAALTKAVNAGTSVSAKDVAAELAPLLKPDLAEAIAEAIKAQPDGNAESIAEEVVSKLVARLEE